MSSNDDDKIITKTMINNYVKQGIMPAPEKKKYGKTHIAYLMVICILKQVYSIGDIGKLISETTRYFELSKAYNRFCGGEFEGMDDVPEGTLVDVVIRPEDVIITKPEDGTVVGEVTSVIFKGMHYEVAVESGKYEMIIRTTKCYHVGDTVGMQLEPDGIHVMLAEDHTTSFVTTINGDYTLDFNGKIISCDLTQVIPKTKMSDGVLVDENGENVDVSKFRVVVSIQPDDIEMSDDVTAGLVSGKIINLIYKGDHYSYVIRTEYGHDLIVDDEYLWNMDDQVGLIMPEEKMKSQALMIRRSQSISEKASFGSLAIEAVSRDSASSLRRAGGQFSCAKLSCSSSRIPATHPAFASSTPFSRCARLPEMFSTSKWM